VVNSQTNYSQQKSFLKISTLKNTFHVNVIHHGEKIHIINHELGVGDILALKNGDRIPVDSIYISDHNFKLKNRKKQVNQLQLRLMKNIHSY
jgi:magnesium-transporting ATPase (P-type)